MGVPREDLLLMMRALKCGVADLKAIRKALARQISKPISLLEALHLRPDEAETLRKNASMPDPVQDRAHLEQLHAALVELEQVTPGEWEKLVSSFTRPSQRHGYGGLHVPQEFDGYTLQWELARRERGVVYRAKNRDGQDVAIKVFRDDVAVPAGFPRVEGHAYTVSDFVEGESLEAKRRSPRRAAEAIQKAAVVLRDRPHGALSSSKVLVRRDDSVAVIGFETAKAVPPSSRSQAYAGGSDTHALGALLYEALTGAPPAGDTAPGAHAKDVDPNLDRIVACALTGGYVSTSEFADDLDRWLKGEPVTGRALTGSAAAGKKASWAWLAAAAVPVAAAIVYFAWPKSHPPPEAPVSTLPDAKPPAPAPSSEASPKPPPKSAASKPIPPLPPPLTPEDEQKLYDACLDAQAKGDADRIVALANEAVARGTRRDWPYYHLANAFITRNELDKALEYVSRALEMAPENRDYLEIRAHTYAFRGEMKKALADLDSLYGKKTADLNRQIVLLSKQLEANSQDGRALLLRGVFYTIKRHYPTAEQDFTGAIEHGHRRALAWRALAFRGDEELDRARSDAKAYLSEFPSDFATEEVKALLRDLGSN